MSKQFRKEYAADDLDRIWNRAFDGPDGKMFVVWRLPKGKKGLVDLIFKEELVALAKDSNVLRIDAVVPFYGS